MDQTISLKQISKIYPEQGETALRDISCEILPGEFVCFIGPSGCGKSTILKIIAGLETPTSGIIIKPQNLSMVFQSGALLPWLTVEENAAFGLQAKGLSKDESLKKIYPFLEMLGLTEHAKKYPRDLSGGQHERVSLARALAVKPSVLLMDEPFAALDPKTTHELHQDILKIWRETKISIVIVSHSIEEAVTLAEKVILVKNGSIKETFKIDIAYPRHERGQSVLSEVEKIRRVFFE